MVEEVPTYTTKEETDRFNDWYFQRIYENSNTSADALKNEVQATVEQDKEVDHDHTKKLPSPCSRNLFEESTSVNTYFWI